MEGSEELRRKYEEWWQKYQESLIKHPERKEEFKNLSGIPLKPLYTPSDLEGFDYLEKLNFPGEFPYTRGIYPGMYRTQAWAKKMLISYEIPETSSRRQREMSTIGHTGFSLGPDSPGFRGYDSDQVDKELVGTCGSPLNFIGDAAIFAEGLPLEGVSWNCHDPSPFTATAMFFALAEEQRIPLWKLKGTSAQTDFISHYVGCWQLFRFPLDASLRILLDHIKFCIRNVPGWNPLSIQSQHMQQSGATLVQELAFTLASGIFYVDESIKAGLDVDLFAPRFTFYFDCTISFFEEIAKFRAARRMWAKIMKEKFGAKDPRSLALRYHVQTSGVELTRQQPLNNITRVAIQALAAVLGGAQSLHTDSYDESYQSPTEEAARIALMTQNIIDEESGVADVLDPLGGSYYIEKLTDEVEERAWEYIEKINDRGGMLEAARQGYIQGEIGRSALEHQRAVDSGKRTVVGLNKYVLPEEQEVRPRRVKPDPVAVEKAVQRVKEHKQKRDQQKARTVLKELCEAALDEKTNVFEAVINAVKGGATLGEIVQELYSVCGKGLPLLSAV